MGPRKSKSRNLCMFLIPSHEEPNKLVNYTILNNLLEELGYSLTITDNVNEINQHRCNALLIRSSENLKLLSSEVKLIIDYLVGGGVLIILLDPLLECFMISNIKELTDVLGIYPRCDVIKVSKHDSTVPIEISEHFKKYIVSSFKEIFYPGGTSLIIKKRPFTKIFLRALYSEGDFHPPIIVFTKYGNGKAIIGGSPMLLSDDALLNEGNLKLAIALLNSVLGLNISKEQVDEIIPRILRKERKLAAKPVEFIQETAKISKEVPKKEEIKIEVSEEAREAKQGVIPPEKILEKIGMLEQAIASLSERIISLEEKIDFINDAVNMISHKLDKLDKKISKDIKDNT